MQNPRRRTLQLSIQHVGQETLIYDEQTHKAFCLNPIAAAVWNRCDGETAIAAIAASASLALSLPLTGEVVQLSLGDLTRDGLLELDTALVPDAVVSRRDLVMKLGVHAALVLPVIVALETPMAAQAYGGCVNCTPPAPNRTPAQQGPTLSGAGRGDGF